MRQRTEFDNLRYRFPRLGFALYAVEPFFGSRDARVTLEVYDNGEIYTFTGETAGEAIDKAFPPPPPKPQPAEEPPPLRPGDAVYFEAPRLAGIVGESEAPPSPPSVFD